MSRVVARLVALSVVLSVPAFAAAQTPAKPLAQTPAQPGRPKQFVVGGMFLGPAGMGSSSADLVRSNGSTLTLFESENSLGPGFGVTAGFGFELTRSMWLEFTGGWSQATLRSDISGDFEDADIEPVRSPMQRFSVEGAALWRLRAATARSGWFIRAGGAWVVELAEGKALAEDGFSGSGTVGWQRAWKMDSTGRKRSGLRISGGLEAQTGGLTLGDSTVRFGPVAGAHIFFGF